MDVFTLPYHQIPFLSRTDLDYLESKPELLKFGAWTPELSAFEQIITARQNASFLDRNILVQVLLDQYLSFHTSSKVTENILKLADQRTFTVCTAHQPTLFTGPLYVIYKIASCINLANQLNRVYPAYQFVPVYVMGGEDHDFEEINHVNIWGQKITWDHQGKGNATARLSTEGIKDVWDRIMSLLDHKLPTYKAGPLFTASYGISKTHGEGNLRFIDNLFQNYGLVTISMDHPRLKSEFQHIIADDLINQTSAGLVRQTQEQLVAQGYSPQAHVRDINLFLFLNGKRQRIEKTNTGFEVGGVSFTTEEMLRQLSLNPEDFSPNVVLRPLLQEYILPNLAYIGGGGEIAYWLERLNQFQHYQIPYPALIRRNSVGILDRAHHQPLLKSGLTYSEICTPDIETFITQRVAAEMDFDLVRKIDEINKIFESLADQVVRIDPTLSPLVQAEKIKTISGLQQIEKKAIKAEKSKQDVQNNRIRKVYAKLFPNHNLQERVENFLPYYLEFGQDLIDQLINTLDPFRREFLFFVDKD